MINKKMLMSAAIAGMMFTAAPHAQAQMNSQAPAGQQAAMQQTSISDAKLDAYVETAIAVSKVHINMAPQIKAAESEQEKQQMYGQMQQQMTGIIEQTDGITVQDYNNISEAAQQDQKLAMTIRTKLEEAQKAVDGR